MATSGAAAGFATAVQQVQAIKFSICNLICQLETIVDAQLLNDKSFAGQALTALDNIELNLRGQV